MKTSPEGRALIESREGVVLSAYKDSAGILTIGVGHTSAAGEPKVTAGLTITARQASEILTRDLAVFEKAVNADVKVPLNQNEFDALVSLVFNIGAGAFKGSTLLRKLNAGDRAGAAEQFLVWNKITVNGKKQTLRGLTTRREAERKQFLSTAKPEMVVPVHEPKPVPVAKTKTFLDVDHRCGIACTRAARLAGAAGFRGDCGGIAGYAIYSMPQVKAKLSKLVEAL